MKPFCDKNSNEDFKKACMMSDTVFSHSELISMLDKGDVVQKQIAALNLETIFDEKEAGFLLKNLTGCDGKIREAVAYRICSICENEPEKAVLFVKHVFSAKIFADATIDINGNICKFVLNTVKKFKYDINFSQVYTQNIIDMILDTFSEIDKFIFKDKKYVINKQLFKLYWCLESMKVYKDFVASETIEKILYRASEEPEYTIREKVAQILSDIDDDKYKTLRLKLKNDDNYYVRRAIG